MKFCVQWIFYQRSDHDNKVLSSYSATLFCTQMCSVFVRITWTSVFLLCRALNVFCSSRTSLLQLDTTLPAHFPAPSACGQNFTTCAPSAPMYSMAIRTQLRSKWKYSKANTAPMITQTQTNSSGMSSSGSKTKAKSSASPLLKFNLTRQESFV